MNDLDTDLLRRALRASREPGPPLAGCTGPDDLTEIITRGRRLRWRRRALAAGGSVCLAAAVVGAVAGVGRLTAPSSGPAQHVVSPVGATRTRPVAAPSPGPGRATPSPVASPTAAPTASPTAAPNAQPTATAVPAGTPVPSRIPPSQPLPTPTQTLPAAGATPSATPSAESAVQHADSSAPARRRS
jgi:hypothetical protein